MEETLSALAGCALYAAIGISGRVWPAAGFVETARETGAHYVELNLARTEVSGRFHEVRSGPASQVVPDWVAGVARVAG